MKSQDISRRKFLYATALATAGIALTSKSGFGMPAYIKNFGKPNSMFNGVQIGAITYSWRDLPDDAESTLKYAVECNINAIELMGDTAEAFAGIPSMPHGGSSARGDAAKRIADWRTSVSMDKFKQLRRMYKDAGVSIYAWKPSALGVNNTDGEIDYACRAAKALGATHVTLEMPEDMAQTRRLAAIGAKHRIYIAYHGHLQQTPTFWDVAINQNKFNAMNLDIGHYVGAGFDPLPQIVKYHNNIRSIHVKDRKNKENGGANTPWGTGDTPIVETLQLIKRNKYKFPCTVELVYQIPEGSDSIKETIKCLEFAKNALIA